MLGRLDTGGMAEILLGQLRGPNGFEHPVVIKRILPHLARDRQFVGMFVDEAQIASGIHHPNVVHVHELGQEGEDLFLVMEYLEGESVASILRRAMVRGIQIDPLLSAWVVAEAAAGLHAAHELKDGDGQYRNVVHRDVSPSNIYVTYSGSVKVLDFGIAKAADRRTKTDAGHVKGKFGYMSPEHCRGEPIDCRSDVFALGIVLYEMLTGRRLFQRPTQAATIRAVFDHDILPPSELVLSVPTTVEQACMKALSRARRRRYAAASELRRDLMRAVHGANDDANPEERMASLMTRLFEERIEEKRLLLKRAERGEDIGDLPLTAADVEVELPEVNSATNDMSGSLVDAVSAESATGRRGLGRVARLSVAGALGILALVGAAWLGRELLSAPTPTLAEPRGATVPRIDRPATASPVRIDVESTPPNATVYLDGEPQGRTPVALSLPRGDEALSLRLELEGHEQAEESIVPNVDQRIRLSLVPTTTPVAVEPAADATRPRGRSTRRARMRADTMRDVASDRFHHWD